ncbi:GntR family transcriptional regulator [Streptomyces sp. NBC_00378]|uniref:GntR family transcriptional regulator n=1 Tax=unclassified Streptomyces TaxID=2593676 RepID=UPI002250F1D3|nr:MULTISPECIES: GntR family transcriptional regulator [unclassified Streptomyces]MCX5107276.1 GntR family transcriptional regulator [Streptomyces sp. NBC_00378]
MAASRHKTLVDAFAADIRTGRLAAGARLPTHRGLAAREGIAVVTATRVYAELETMGNRRSRPHPGAGSVAPRWTT